MIETKQGFRFKGRIVDVLRMTACHVHTLEKRGFSMDEMKRALLFLDKPKGMTGEQYQEIQLAIRGCLNGEAREW